MKKYYFMLAALSAMFFATLFVLFFIIPSDAANAQQPVQTVGPPTMNTGQVSVGTSATLIRSAQYRGRITVNVQAANTCAFGGSTVTTSTGYALAPTIGASAQIDSSAAVYGVCSATTTVSWLEVQ